MKPDPALKEAARVAAMKRVATAKFAAGMGGKYYEFAALLIDAIYEAFPPVPEPAAKTRTAKRMAKPHGD